MRTTVLHRPVIRLIAVVLGMAVVFMLPSQSRAQTTNTAVQGITVIGTSLGGASTDLRATVASIIRVAFGILGIFLVAVILYGGFLYFTAGGDDERRRAAVTTIRNGIIGMVIVLCAYAIVEFVVSRLVAATTTPAGVSVDLSGPATGGSGGGNGSSPVPFTFTDALSLQFNQGTYDGATYNDADQGVELAPGATTGTYVSSVKDAGTPAATWTSLTWTPSLFGPGATAAAGAASVPTDTALLLQFNDPTATSTFVDSSGNGNTATCASITFFPCPTVVTPGIDGGAATFEYGATGYLAVPDTSSLEFTNDTFTVSFWANFTSVSDLSMLSKPWNGNGQYNFIIDTLSDGRPEIYFQGYTAGGTYAGDKIQGNEPLPTNTWVQLTFSLGSGWGRIYLNNTVIASSTSPILSSGPALGYVNEHDPLAIGRNFPYGGTDSYTGMNGALADLAIYHHSFSPTDVAANYARGAEHLRFQVRSCPDAACATASFSGPDGTSGTYYAALPSAPLNAAVMVPLTTVPPNRYFQYAAFLDSTAPNSSLGITEVVGNAGE